MGNKGLVGYYVAVEVRTTNVAIHAKAESISFLPVKRKPNDCSIILNSKVYVSAISVEECVNVILQLL